MKPDLETLRQRLLARFPDASLRLSDDSHLHAGHTGSAGGAGHFTVDIVSETFAGHARVARHRLVYDAVADWMPHRIHALIVKATTPAESAAASGSGPTGTAPPDPTHQ
jgi:BolA family transcriptional regulator, general stress-responsive regulator